MSFYTFVMDYAGGTHVSQVDASSEKAACRKWAENLEVSEIYEFGAKSREILINKMESEEIVPLDGLKNVWCISASIRGRLALTTFIKTEIPNNPNPKSQIQNLKSNDVS